MTEHISPPRPATSAVITLLSVIWIGTILLMVIIAVTPSGETLSIAIDLRATVTPWGRACAALMIVLYLALMPLFFRARRRSAGARPPLEEGKP